MLTVRTRGGDKAHGHGKKWADDDHSEETTDSDDDHDDSLWHYAGVDGAARVLGSSASWLLRPFTSYVHLLAVPKVCAPIASLPTTAAARSARRDRGRPPLRWRAAAAAAVYNSHVALPPARIANF